ncbi:phospholipase C [Bacillus pakistanensis]|uniref:Phospholipase C n=1 Tax=Rossellomorea pakistanensis TaxID=992288 RepID=A0ABS2NCE3_9BACI|nr:sphingomyelin phosphodiesterase [Bacillus pakistanensis]MBM7585503.1 phospholipase C [Bacillus pakistanensis]
MIEKMINLTKFLVVAALVLPVIVFSSTVSAEESDYPNDFKLMAHNVYMLSQSLYPNWGQVQRADLISNADYIKGQDVVILNEVFDNEASNKLLNGLENDYPYQTPVLGRSTSNWDETLGSYSYTTPEDGGAAIVSKWPIVEKIQYVYKDGCGADWLANKGFVYVKINKNGHFYHVIGTHMQSEDERCSDGEAASVRKAQMDEISGFIDQKDIPASEVVYIGGDLNVIKGTPEYSSMLKDLNVNAPTAYTGFTSTWDPDTNGIAGYNYPQLEPQYLDYIFVEKSHKQPSNWYINAMNIKSPEWSVTSFGKTYTYNEYSDHYPVAGYSVP